MRKISRRLALYALLGIAALAGFFVLRGLAESLADHVLADLPVQAPAPTLRDPPTGRGEDLTVRIVVLGPGDELYFWWGHIAMVIDDAGTGQSHFFDYGLFSFDQENFFVNFALGRLIYSTGVMPAQLGILGYVRTNRDVIVYTLDLPPDAREMILRQAEWDVLPENRDYLYHHFDHNCATPLIYLIDMATGGQFRERFANEPSRFTLRQHVRRHTWHSPFIDWILNFWMGQNIDLPITAWEDMFLPSEVGRNIAAFEYVDPDGAVRRLVSSREVVFQSQGRPAVLETPRAQWPRQLAFSLAVSLLLALLFFLQAGKSARAAAFGRVSLGVCHGVFGLAFGGAGLMLFFMANFTGHDYTFGNANILFANPLLLALIPLGIRYAAAGDRGKRQRHEFYLRLLWLMVVLGIFVSMLVKLTPWFWQDNLTDQMLMLPIALVLLLEPAGLKVILRRVRRQA